MSEFRVEIPVEVSAHGSGLSKLEAELTRLYASAQRVGAAASAALSQMGSGAAGATAGMQGAAAGAEQAAAGYAQAGAAATTASAEASAAGQTAAAAAENMGQSADKAADSMEKVGDAGQQAGQQASSGLEQAAGAADKFSARMEKSEQSIRKMIGQKISMTLDAIDKVSPILNRITSGVKNLTSKAWKVAVKMVDFVTAPFRALKRMIMSPIMMTLGITGIGIGASSFVSTFQDFTAGMSNVKALSGATNEEFLKLTETAETLGATTKFTATEASEGMQYLAMAGWKTNDIIAAMPGLLDLAAAGGTSLGTAADIVSDVMTAMGMKATEASRAADIFARTATGSNTTIENLGESLKYAAPAAHAFGLSLSEAATITGMMANAGVKGSMAGTALRASLLEMASPSKKASEAMSKLNLTFADSSGKMKDMKTIIKDLSTAFSGLSEQEKLGYAEDLFGTRGSSAWLAVIEQGADEFDRLFESIDKSNGAAKEMANTQLDNLAGDVTLLKSAVDGMKISVMKELDPYLRKGVQWLTSKIPDITEKLTNVAKTAIEKFGQVKDFLVGVFNSDDFKKADGFADKLFVAWDKIIAEPFAKWWEGGGKDKILGLVSKIGTNLGQVYHGVISGIFAAIKGEEIDFEGLNLTGLAKAGAEAAKSFVDSFMKAFDLSGLIGKMPGILKAALAGFAAIKVGGGVLGVARVVRDLKIAFGAVAPAATSAGTAIAGVGAKAAAGTGLLAKLGSGIGVIGKGLAAIPGWGWAAAAVIAAVTIGVIAYNKAQEAREQALKDTGKAAAQYEQEYVRTARNIENAMATMDEIKTIQIKIEENKGGNQKVIQEVQDEMDGILDEYVYLIAQLNRDDLTPEQIAALEEDLKKVDDKTATLTAKLIQNDYDPVTAGIIIDQFNGIKENNKEITLILSTKTDMTPEEIQQTVNTLNSLSKTKTEKELLITGHNLLKTEGTDAIEALERQLDVVKTRKAQVEAEIVGGNSSKSLVAEYENLISKAGQLETTLKGAKMSTDEINQVKEDLAAIKGEAENLVVNIALEGDFTQDDLDKVMQLFSDNGDHHFEADIALKNTGMEIKDMDELIKKQNELYRNMVETSGGVFTERDLAAGRITQEDYDWWVETQQKKAEAERQEFNAQVIKDRENMPTLMERADEMQGKVDSAYEKYENLREQRKAYEDLDYQRRMMKVNPDYFGEQYSGGISMEGREAIMQLAKDLGEAMPDNADAKRLADAAVSGEFLDVFDYLFGNGADKRWEELQGTSESDRDKAYEEYEKQNAKLKEYTDPMAQQYANEVAMATHNATAELPWDSGLRSKSIEEMANDFVNLDEAGRKAFASALEGVQKLNDEAEYIDYLPEDQVMNVEKMMDTAIGTVQIDNAKDALGDLKSKLIEIQEAGETNFTKEQAKGLEDLAKALDLKGIEGFKDIGSAIEQINNLDPASVDLDPTGIESVMKALGSTGTEAEATKTKLQTAKAAATALAGTYEVKVKYIEEGSLPDAPGTKNAYGGIYDGAFLSWVAEDGPEAIIPLGADKRGRGLDLWMQAGRALGVGEFADGGIMAPYTGLMDEDFDEGERGLPSPGSSSGGGVVVQVNAEVNPTFQIEGGDGEDILDKLKSKQKELAELFGGAIADQLEDIVANMV